MAMIDPEYTEVYAHRFISRRIDQSIGLRSTACVPSGAVRRKIALSTATPPTIAASAAVDDRQVKPIPIRAGRMTVEVPSPTPPPTAANSPLVNARSFGGNHREIAPDIAT